MGLGSEMFEGVLFKDWFKQILDDWEKTYVPTSWTTSKGEILFIKDMTTEHITNCINWLKREHADNIYTRRMIRAFEAELERRKPPRHPKFYSLD